MDKSQKYRSFLLTAWQENAPEGSDESVWRFGLEDARDTNPRRVFINLEEVMAYVTVELKGEAVESQET